MVFNITSDQLVPVSVVFEDDHGNPASVDGVPVWTSSDITILTVVAAADGMSCVVTAVGPDGSATVAMTANANMDPTGVAIPVAGSLAITVVSGAAAQALVTPGTPALQVIIPVPVGP
jgi:hypothetical protein